MEKTTKLSIAWKNRLKVEIGYFTVNRKESLLYDIRREIPTDPLGFDIYWRDDMYDPEIFHAHRKVMHNSDSLGDSVATAYIVKG